MTNNPTLRPHEQLGTHWLTLRLHAQFLAIVRDVPRHNRERTATRDDLSRLRIALAEAVDVEDVAQLEKAWRLALRIAVRFETLHAEHRLDAKQLAELHALLCEIQEHLAVLLITDPSKWLATIPVERGRIPAGCEAGVGSVVAIVGDAAMQTRGKPANDERVEQPPSDGATRNAASAPRSAPPRAARRKRRGHPPAHRVRAKARSR
jgi:hypothetical protein